MQPNKFLFRKVLESHNLTPIKLTAKEGLAMINGTQLITSIGAEAVERAGIIARQADVVAALTLEVLKGSSRAFDPGIKKTVVVVVVVVTAVVVGVRG